MQLSVNDTTFDTIWTSLLSSSNENPNMNLRHPVFSSHVILSDASPLQSSLTSSKPSRISPSTDLHRLEGLGSLFGALSFAHPSVILKSSSSVPDEHNFEVSLAKMRIDISGDRLSPLELPKMEKEEKERGAGTALPKWLEAQRWKGAGPLADLLIPAAGKKDDATTNNCDYDYVSTSNSKDTLSGLQKHVLLPSAIGKKDTVADWIERTWHGAAGPLAPWRSSDTDGIPIEEDPLEWKDRLVNRARILNWTAETVAALLADYMEHINSLFPDSLLTANAFSTAVKRFINFWRGELLFAERKLIEQKRHLQSTPTRAHPQRTRSSNLEHILPPIHVIPHHLEAKMSDTDGTLASSSSSSSSVPTQVDNDFVTSFDRIVSSTGSYTQIVHLYNLVTHMLGTSSNSNTTRFPIGTQLLNNLVDFCTHTEMDPLITLGITRRLLSLTLVPFARYFSEWIFWGSLPIHKEFMVEDSSHSVSPLSGTSGTSGTSRSNDEYWLANYSIKTTHVPDFLRKYEEIAVKTGALVQILRRLDRLVSRDESKRSPSDTQAPTLRPIWSLSLLEEYQMGIQQYIHGGELANLELWVHVKELRKMESDGVVSVEQCLYDSFVEPLIMQFNWVSPMVCDRLVNEWKYVSVIERLKTDYFGSLVSASFDALPLGVDLLDASASSHTLERLRIIFAENLQGTLEKLGYRLALERVPQCSGIDVLDNILIEPTFVHWPLSIIITPTHLQHFHSIFILLTKMTRARAALNAIWTGLSEATRLAHRQYASYRASQKRRISRATDESIFEVDYNAIFKVLHKSSLLCNQLQHFWGQLYAFVANQVVHTSFHQLKQSATNAKHFEDLINAQEGYVTSVMKSAMLASNSRALMVVIEKTLHLVHKFRQQIRLSLADPSKWEIRTRKQPLSMSESSTLEASIFGGAPSPSPTALTEDSLNISVFEQSQYQPEELDAILNATRTDFEKCVKFLLVVLLKLLAHGYEPHMAALVASINWNKFYFTGTEILGHDDRN